METATKKIKIIQSATKPIRYIIQTAGIYYIYFLYIQYTYIVMITYMYVYCLIKNNMCYDSY
jgi:hypothetical protein